MIQYKDNLRYLKNYFKYIDIRIDAYIIKNELRIVSGSNNIRLIITDCFEDRIFQMSSINVGKVITEFENKYPEYLI